MDAKGFEVTLEELAKKETENTQCGWELWLEDLQYEATPGEKWEVKSEIVTVEIIEAQTGGEDVFAGGEGDVFLLFKVNSSAGEQYFKKTGTYHSYVGTDWEDGYKEVKPITKTVVVYE